MKSLGMNIHGINRKNQNRIWRAVALTAALLLFAGGSLEAYASQASQQSGVSKEENIYVNLSLDGSAENLYVVNSWLLETATELLDYGKYTSVRNLTTDAPISHAKGQIRVQAPAGRFRYQGTLDGAELPWEIAISWRLEGEEIDGAELAGKTGRLEMRIGIEPGEAADKAFTNHYQLQVTIPMDMTRCSNLQAAGAATANAGKQKQLIYTILPGQDREIVLTADVVDFEMDSILFQGLPVSMEMDNELLDLEELRERTEELSGKAEEFSEDALTITGGADSLREGISGLAQGTGTLRDGLKSYTDGTGMIEDGMQMLQEGSEELLNGSGQLAGGITALRQGIDQLNGGFQGDNGLVSGSAQLADGIKQIRDRIQEMADGVGNMDLAEIQEELLNASRALLDAEADLLIARAKTTLQEMELEEPAWEGNQEEQLWRLSGHLKTLIVRVAVELGNQTEGGSGAEDSGTANSESGGSIAEETSDEGTSGEEGSESGNPVHTEEDLETLLNLRSDTDQLLGNYETLGQMSDLPGGGDMPEQLEEIKTALDAFLFGIGQLSDGASALADGIRQVGDGVEALSDGASQLESGGYQLTDGIRQFGEGISGFSDGAKELENAAQGLLDGANQLFDSSSDFAEGIGEVADTARELRESTDSFKDQTSDMEENLNEDLDRALDEFSSEGYRPVSFTSDQNENVTLVQFEMKTSAIRIPQEPAKIHVEEKKGFWERLLALFGLV